MELTILTNFPKSILTSSKISFAESMTIHVEDFDDFYANYITRDKLHMLADDDFGDFYAN